MHCSNGNAQISSLDMEERLPLDATSLRLLNLLFILNAAPGPLSTTRILSDTYLGYEASERNSSMRKFQRDRERLAEHGVVIRETRAADSAENEESLWEIDRARTHAQEGVLAPEDAEAVLAAIDETFVLHADDPTRWPLQRARLKLCELAGIPAQVFAQDGAAPAEQTSYSASMQEIWSAFTRRRAARFFYRGGSNADSAARARELRIVELYGMFTQGSHVYLVGKDVEKNALRTFRTDRIIEAKHAPDSSPAYSIPEDFTIENNQFLPFDFSDAKPVEAVFSFPATLGKSELELLTLERGALSQTGEAEETDGNRWLWTVEVRDINAAASFALQHVTLGMAAEQPQELVEAVALCVRKAVGAHER